MGQGEPRLMAYPFPFDDGRIGKLQLPIEGLRPDEAQRLKAFIDSLVIEREEA